MGAEEVEMEEVGASLRCSPSDRKCPHLKSAKKKR